MPQVPIEPLLTAQSPNLPDFAKRPNVGIGFNVRLLCDYSAASQSRADEDFTSQHGSEKLVRPEVRNSELIAFNSRQRSFLNR